MEIEISETEIIGTGALKHTIYLIKLTPSELVIRKRYREFEKFHKKIQSKKLKDFQLLKLPPKVPSSEFTQTRT